MSETSARVVPGGPVGLPGGERSVGVSARTAPRVLTEETRAIIARTPPAVEPGEDRPAGPAPQIGAAPAAFAVTQPASAAPVWSFGRITADRIIGSDASNIIVGLAGDDTVHAGAGADRVFAGLDDDLVFGGAGRDAISGFSGNDLLYGGLDADQIRGDAGADRLFGDWGTDLLWGGDDADVLFGGTENDRMSGDAGDDLLWGGDGNDGIAGGLGADRVGGGDGNDALYGGEGDDVLTGDADSDLLQGGSGADSVSGGDGNDRIFGQDGNDFVSGGNGNDVLSGGIGSDEVRGGEGNDLLVLSGSFADYSISRDGDTLTFTDLSGHGEGTDIVTGVEFVRFADGTVKAEGLAQPVTMLWSDIVAEYGAEALEDMDLYVPDGVLLMIDSDVSVKSLFIEGGVEVLDENDISLTADWILAHDGGSFVAGSEETPFAHRLVITLTGEEGAAGSGGVQNAASRLTLGHDHAGHEHAAAPGPQESNPTGHGMLGNRFFSAMGDGSAIELISTSAAKTSWTQLGASAAAGDDRIILKEGVDWQPGDRFVIATTDFDTTMNETFTVTAISPNGRVITLDRPLEWSHFGELQTYSADGRTMVLDERAEVGLLSRNIVVQGAEDSADTGYGAHMMMMEGSFAEIEGVEMTRVGQAGTLGRYPFHWHLAGDVTGQCFMNNSVYESYNRAVTLHGTSNANVLDNVAFDITGHAYFMENGTETGNRLVGNLAVQVNSTPGGVLATDAEAAGFWVTDWNNTITGNAVAGAAHGFWFEIPDGPQAAAAPGAPAHSGYPAPAAQGLIKGNVAHSLTGNGYFAPAVTDQDRVVTFEDFLVYKADQACWSNGKMVSIRHIDTIAADLQNFGIIQGDVVQGGLRVGLSANLGNLLTEAELEAGRDLLRGRTEEYKGFAGYDVPLTFEGMLIAGFDADNPAFQTASANFKTSIDFLRNVTFAGNMSFADRIGLFVDDLDRGSCQFLDLDGSIAGDGRFAAYVGDPAQNRTYTAATTGFVSLAGARWNPEAGLVRNREALGGLLIGFDEMLGDGSQGIRIDRSDGEYIATEGIWGEEASPFSTLVARDGSYSYSAEFDDFTPPQIRVKFYYVEQDDVLRLTFRDLDSFVSVSDGTRVFSMGALDAATGMAWFWDGQNLHLRIVTNDTPFDDIGTEPARNLVHEGDITITTRLPGPGEQGGTVVTGSNAADVEYGFGGNDALYGFGGRDTLVGGIGDDSLNGGEAEDLLVGGFGVDRIEGGGGADTVRGGSDGDQLFGGAGDDSLSGERHEDILVGGDGRDRLSGGHGKDQLWGEGGADTFVMEYRGDTELIMDFEDGIDRVDLSETGVRFADLDIRKSWGVTTAIWNDGDYGYRIAFEGIAIAELSADDFIF